MISGPRVRIWDLPVRLFHWAIVLLVPAMWATHHYDRMDLHILLGQVFLGLLLFRLIWGITGSSTARFSSFVKGPAAVARYLRGQHRSFGHNPLGGWSVAALLLVLTVQIGLGLFASDEDGFFYGPLSHHLELEKAHDLAGLHETLFWILAGLIALHVLAILYYLLVKRDDMVTPMITGSRPAAGAGMVPAPLWRLLSSAALAAGLTLALVKLL